MNYNRIYDSIINRARARGLTKSNLLGYYEYHHIIPRCMDGDNNTNTNNLVLLSAKEHFICHALLCYIYPNNSKLLYAFHMMKNTGTNTNRYSSGCKYSKLKENHSQAMKDLQTDSILVHGSWVRSEDRKYSTPFTVGFFLLPKELVESKYRKDLNNCNSLTEYTELLCHRKIEEKTSDFNNIMTLRGLPHIKKEREDFHQNEKARLKLEAGNTTILPGITPEELDEKLCVLTPVTFKKVATQYVEQFKILLKRGLYLEYSSLV